MLLYWIWAALARWWTCDSRFIFVIVFLFVFIFRLTNEYISVLRNINWKMWFVCSSRTVLNDMKESLIYLFDMLIRLILFNQYQRSHNPFNNNNFAVVKHSNIGYFYDKECTTANKPIVKVLIEKKTKIHKYENWHTQMKQAHYI